MIKYDFFQSVKHVLPIAQSKSFEDFTQIFVNFDIAETKNDRSKCFSFTQYHPGLTRGKENILFMTGFVFDFDNKDCDPVPVKDITKILEDKAITFLWYHTFSHKNDHLRWRLIIPFGNYIRLDVWEEIYEKGLKLIGNPPGIDPVCRKASQIYFYPYQPKHCDTMFQAETYHGHLLNPFHLDKLDEKKTEIISIPIENKQSHLKKEAHEIDEFDKIKEALKFISPDIDYIDWIKVGMSLKNELGDVGMDIWDNWSKGGMKYVNRKEIQYHWNTFNSDGIKIGSLYALAKERGYKIPGYSTETKTLIKTTYVEKDITIYREQEEDIIEKSLTTIQNFICRDIFDIPCSIVKELYNWVNDSSYIVQPIYSLATTIAIMGFIKRNVICSPTNLKTNLYILSMGPSRSGKNNGIDRINQIMEALKLDKYLVNGIGSHQGLLREMKENNGYLFINSDEISYMIKSMQSKNAQSYENNIEQKLLSLYNCKYQTSDAIKGEKVERIANPFLHIYSTTTEQILSALKPQSATSGLLARFLIFQVNPGMPYRENLHPKDDLPKLLLDDLASLQKETFRKAVLNADASLWFREFRDKVRTVQQSLSVEESNVDSLFGNLAELSIKLALLTTPFKEEIPFGDIQGRCVEKWPFIRIEDIQWGSSVAIHCLKNNTDLAGSVSDNSNEKIIKKILKKIKEKTKDGNWIPKSDVYKLTRCESSIYAFDGFIHMLYESGDIDIEKNRNSRGFKVRWISPTIRREMDEEKLNGPRNF